MVTFGTSVRVNLCIMYIELFYKWLWIQIMEWVQGIKVIQPQNMYIAGGVSVEFSFLAYNLRDSVTVDQQPKTMFYKALVKIIRNNSALINTILFEHPSLLYSLANIHLIELSSTLIVAHFTLDIPIVNKGKALEIFRAAQVGMVVMKQDNLSLYYDLHTSLYKDNGVLFEFSTQDCKKHNDLQGKLQIWLSKWNLEVRIFLTQSKLLNKTTHSSYIYPNHPEYKM